MASLFAFLHHAAAFALVAALAVQLVLLRDDLSLKSARKLQATDMALGISAGILLVVGLLRVFYFEKGAGYYFSNVPFIVKLALFLAVALLSLLPTFTFLSWRASLKRGELPAVAPGRLRTVRAVVHFELAAVVVILLCAALMARGIGSSSI
jgi:putative membrane protein